MRSAMAAWRLGRAPALLLVLALGGEAAAQAPMPSASRRTQGEMLDQIERSVTRPLPQPPPVTPRPPGDAQWVPEQRVMVPGVGEVQVPGHWQHRLPSGDVAAPPVVGRAVEDGSTVILPGGRLPPPSPRQAP